MPRPLCKLYSYKRDQNLPTHTNCLLLQSKTANLVFAGNYFVQFLNDREFVLAAMFRAMRPHQNIPLTVLTGT